MAKNNFTGGADVPFPMMPPPHHLSLRGFWKFGMKKIVKFGTSSGKKGKFGIFLGGTNSKISQRGQPKILKFGRFLLGKSKMCDII